MAGKGKKLTEKEKKLVQALTKVDGNVSAAGRLAGFNTRQDAHQTLSRVQEKFPEVLNRKGMTDERLAELFNEGAERAMKPLVSDGIVMDSIADEELRFKYRWAIAKMKGVDSPVDAGIDPSRAQRSGITLVVADERAAANIALVLSAGRSDHLVIDVDARVDQNVG